MRTRQLTASGLAALVIFASGCSSVQQFSERQGRYAHYVAAAHSIPSSATRAQVYAALPPAAPPKPPVTFSSVGAGAFGTEIYPLDAHYEVVVPFMYWHTALANPRDLMSTQVVQSDDDTIYGDRPVIRERTDIGTTHAGNLAPVPGKPGFFEVPDTSGYLDCRGYPPGAEIRDPATGKIWTIPAS